MKSSLHKHTPKLSVDDKKIDGEEKKLNRHFFKIKKCQSLDVCCPDTDTDVDTDTKGLGK